MTPLTCGFGYNRVKNRTAPSGAVTPTRGLADRKGVDCRER